MVSLLRGSGLLIDQLDGFGLLAKLKREDAPSRLKVIPVIMLTARGGDESKVEGLLAGAEGGCMNL